MRPTGHRRSFPRTRGDGPAPLPDNPIGDGFPPHTRGWTAKENSGGSKRKVSPAHAGMDRQHVPGKPRQSSFPPHTRGWTWASSVAVYHLSVSPAHAGMDRYQETPGVSALRFPRTRGDGPCWYGSAYTSRRFPPHTRGWTSYEIKRIQEMAVSPAHAGMDLTVILLLSMLYSFPRTRGDGPDSVDSAAAKAEFPPHTRGWTAWNLGKDVSLLVSPAHAGMDPIIGDPQPSLICFPPHTRGWTVINPNCRQADAVSPAHAGMDPIRVDAQLAPTGFPRTRGDGPFSQAWIALARAFPRTRGDGPHPHLALDVGRLFPPAHAGMDLLALFPALILPSFPRTRGDGPYQG